MENELICDLADAQSFYTFVADFPFDIGSLEVVDSMSCDEKASLLFFFIVVELVYGTAH